MENKGIILQIKDGTSFYCQTKYMKLMNSIIDSNILYIRNNKNIKYLALVGHKSKNSNYDDITKNHIRIDIKTMIGLLIKL